MFLAFPFFGNYQQGYCKKSYLSMSNFSGTQPALVGLCLKSCNSLWMELEVYCLSLKKRTICKRNVGCRRLLIGCFITRKANAQSYRFFADAMIGSGDTRRKDQKETKFLMGSFFRKNFIENCTDYACRFLS